ncbi:IS30 family transposase [Fluviicola taffensis]|uniref:IS30 family transposase n=1 Tax=Fluviicola taffensis TaxID=191579 RepID=UPI0031381E20
MSHLTYEQRYTISVMLQAGYTQASISEALGRNKSVISREIARNRNGNSKKYHADLAQRKCDARHKQKNKRVKLTPSMLAYIISSLEDKLSPEQIVGLSKLNGISCISHQWIYQLIWSDKKRRGKLCRHLRNRGKRYKKYDGSRKMPGQPANKRDISERPSVVDQRERFGDLEVDTVIGKHRKSALVTINDRATGILKMGLVKEKTSSLVTQKITELLTPWKQHIHTMTADNGPEFTKFEIIVKDLDIEFFFARPYQSWQRGSNENLNRLVRQYFPKGTDFDKIDPKQVAFVENQINHRPRKRYNFRSPLEMFNQKLHL